MNDGSKSGITEDENTLIVISSQYTRVLPSHRFIIFTSVIVLVFEDGSVGIFNSHMPMIVTVLQCKGPQPH